MPESESSFLKRASGMLLKVVYFLPISVSSISINYTFVLLFIRRRLRFHDNKSLVRDGSLYLAYCVICYIVGFVLFFNGNSDFLVRQFFSFSVFILPVLLLLIRLDFSVEEILLPTLIATTLYSSYVLFIVLTNSEFSIFYAPGVKAGLREYVSDWPQRYVVLICFIIPYAYREIKRKKLFIPVFSVLALCAYLTFTRSAYLCVLIGIFSYHLALVANSMTNFKLPTLGWNRSILFASMIVFLGGVILSSEELKDAILFLWEKFVNSFSALESGTSVDNSSNIRYVIWTEILEFVQKNPLTGTGFAGIYLFEGIRTEHSSAHNQYLDILLRSGLIGLMFYLYFWGKILIHYFTRNAAVFGGLISVFVYGFMHETTKLTYVTLLFFVLINKSYERSR